MSKQQLEDGGTLHYPDYEDNQMPKQAFGRGDTFQAPIMTFKITKGAGSTLGQPVRGRKADEGKLPWHLLPFDVLEQIVEILRLGAVKYDARNWENGLAYSRTFAATMRHMFAWWRGEELDAESGKHHLAHALCELMFTFAHVLRKTPSCDDRPQTGRLAK
jgi:hypothetical protein